jgi:hypothetical protein
MVEMSIAPLSILFTIDVAHLMKTSSTLSPVNALVSMNNRSRHGQTASVNVLATVAAPPGTPILLSRLTILLCESARFEQGDLALVFSVALVADDDHRDVGPRQQSRIRQPGDEVIVRVARGHIVHEKAA